MSQNRTPEKGNNNNAQQNEKMNKNQKANSGQGFAQNDAKKK